MELNEYGKKAAEFAIYDQKWNLIYPILGLASESGEIAGKFKKVLRDNNGELTSDTKQMCIAELGDVLWYVAAIARDLDSSLEEVAMINLGKLQSRKDRNCLKGSGDNR